MIYYKVEKQGDQISLVEDQLDKKYTLKTETVFSQCNGYIGVRASHETKMLVGYRGMFVAGLFHQAGEHEVTELINCPDLVEMDIRINGEPLNLETCQITSFRRRLNLMTGELHTVLKCNLETAKGITLDTRRFASMDDRHLFCHQVNITVQEPAAVEIGTGINGQITNSGVSHFDNVVARVFDKKYMYTENSCDDGQVLHVMTVCCDKFEQSPVPVFGLKRRSVAGTYKYAIKANETLGFAKYSYILTGIEQAQSPCAKMQVRLAECEALGYEELLAAHTETFAKLWKFARVEIKGASSEEEAALCFAQYHLFGMTPFDTDQYSVGSKALTGEGYKGHVFWDTDLFVMPFFTSTFPEAARNLLKYRYHGLEGARAKAKDYGYKGALYPWETAQKDGYEVTPLYAALNIHTGVAAKVWSGIKEHHITADVIYAVWSYWILTGDDSFIDQYGYEMFIETAMFWCTRATFIEANNRYEILDVIGPDEYTEHVDNNAYTNYLAAENVAIALKAMNELKEKNPARYAEFDQRYNLDEQFKVWEDFLTHIYLPAPNADGLIPQDDTFLSKPELPNVKKYQDSKIKQEVLLDFSREEVIDRQAIKQADVVMLLNIYPDKFDAETVMKNVRYYEARTLHDSSLSYSSHAIACAAIGDTKMAYKFFQKAMEVDLDTNEKDSLDGIHSASLGGIWNCIINGFAGVKYHQDYIEICPHLPAEWEEINFYMQFKGQGLRIRVDREKVVISKDEPAAGRSVHFKVNDQIVEIEDETELYYQSRRKYEPAARIYF